MRRGRLAIGMAAVALGAAAPGVAAPLLTPEGTTDHLVRQACSYQWIVGVCEPTNFPDPGYRPKTEPHLTQPLMLYVGAVHEHSGYSDGDPAMRPRDYFRAGRTGHNTADNGGDTGVILDFMLSSEHSDNTQIPITTAAVCVSPTRALECWRAGQADHYRKWPATLEQAREASDAVFTAMRGFEYTNDYYNHLGVYFSRNFVNVKIDGSYIAPEFFWSWLREPAIRGGGDDALVVFNHPGGYPHLTPFDESLPTSQVLAQIPGGGNWKDLKHIPDLDERFAGIEVNGGDDIDWYKKALTNGWHLGPVAAEDEHQREWATSADGKTLMLTRGRSPEDYYFALQHHRTIAVREELIGGAPGTKATFPNISFMSGGSVLGSTVSGPSHTLRFQASGLPAGAPVALVSDARAPVALGTADAAGTIDESYTAIPPANGEDWYFAVVCPVESGAKCGTDESHLAVTAPIWLRR